MAFENQTHGSQFSNLLYAYSKLMNMPMRIGALNNFPALNIGRMDGSSVFYVRKRATSGQPVSDIPTGNNTIRGLINGYVKEDPYGVLKFTAAMLIPFENMSKYEKALEMNPALAIEPFTLQFSAVQMALTNITEKFAWRGVPSAGTNIIPVSGFATSPNTQDSGQTIDFSKDDPIDIYNAIANAVGIVRNNAIFNGEDKDIVLAYPGAMNGLLNQYITIGSTPIARTLKTALTEDAGVDRLIMVRDDYLTLNSGNLGWIVMAVGEDACGLGIDSSIVRKGIESVSEITAGDHLGRILLDKVVVDETNARLINDGLDPFNLITPNCSPLVITYDGFGASFWMNFAGGIVPYEGYAVSIDTSIKATSGTFQSYIKDSQGNLKKITAPIQQPSVSHVEISTNGMIVNESLLS